jgi:hypothetical protein
VSIVFESQFDGENVLPANLGEYCETNGLSQYSYPVDDLDFVGVDQAS